MDVKLFYLRKYSKVRKYDAFWSRARQSEISSWPLVKSTRASSFMLKWGDVRRCDSRAFRANLLSVLYGSVLIEVWAIRPTIIVPRLALFEMVDQQPWRGWFWNFPRWCNGLMSDNILTCFVVVVLFVFYVCFFSLVIGASTILANRIYLIIQSLLISFHSSSRIIWEQEGREDLTHHHT